MAEFRRRVEQTQEFTEYDLEHMPPNRTAERFDKSSKSVDEARTKAQDRVQTRLGDGNWRESFEAHDAQFCATTSTRAVLGLGDQRQKQRVHIENEPTGIDMRATLPQWGSVDLATRGVSVTYAQPSERQKGSADTVDAYNQKTMPGKKAALDQVTDPEVIMRMTSGEDGINPKSLRALAHVIETTKGAVEKPQPAVSVASYQAGDAKPDVTCYEYALSEDPTKAADTIESHLAKGPGSLAKGGLLVATLPMHDNRRVREEYLDTIQKSIGDGYTARVLPTALTVPHAPTAKEIDRPNPPQRVQDLGFTLEINRPVPVDRRGRPTTHLAGGFNEKIFFTGLSKGTETSFAAAKKFDPERATAIDGRGARPSLGEAIGRRARRAF